MICKWDYHSDITNFYANLFPANYKVPIADQFSYQSLCATQFAEPIAETFITAVAHLTCVEGDTTCKLPAWILRITFASQCVKALNAGRGTFG